MRELKGKPKRIKHNYCDELELKSLIIRINNRVRNENEEHYNIDDSNESIVKNDLVNRYIKIYKKLKASKSVKPSRKSKLRKSRNVLKQLIIDESVKTTIDKNSHEKFGSLVLLMIKSILTKPNFSSTGYDSEFYSNSTYKITKYIHNFDHLKISPISGLPGNAFAYISQIINNAFLFVCNQKRDERIHHKKQVNMEMLDENQCLKYVDLHVDDQTKFHNEDNTIEETINIVKIENDSTLVKTIQKILEHNKLRFLGIDKINIIYPLDYRINMEEFNEMKPLLNGKFTINRKKEPVIVEDEEEFEGDDLDYA